MRPTFSAPAEQLRSVSARYRGPRGCGQLSYGGAAKAAGQRWRLFSSAEVHPSRADSARDGRLQRLEAVLFLAREPLSSRKLSQFASLADGTEARTLVGQLNGLYDERGRAFRVEEVGGGFQLLSRPKFAPWLRRLGHVPAEMRLSAPALETLAVVAYRQPVPRADIEAIRGVNCGEILRQLMERDLVRIGGRSDELGRPYLYATTRRFLQVFGLRDAADLPRAEMLRTTLAQATASAEDQQLSTRESIDPLETPQETEEESDVKLTMPFAAQLEEETKRARRAAGTLSAQAADEYDDEDLDEEEEEDEDWDDDEDDFDEEDEDWDEEEVDEDEFEDEDFEEEEEDEDEDDDFEDEEWEEVEDDEEFEEDEEDDDWDDDEDEDDDGWDDEDED